ncbi:hypothetical protein ACIO3O_00515 [Streptomyces sp. NPDC087440]|uniref:hypothetical protein n=1 Tax=Streptomyces sp. NPDC087440 TaxID=3365790 RepID=UPI003817E032
MITSANYQPPVGYSASSPPPGEGAGQDFTLTSSTVARRPPLNAFQIAFEGRLRSHAR